MKKLLLFTALPALLGYMVANLLSYPGVAFAKSSEHFKSFTQDSTNAVNAIYHWKTTFAPDSTELAFLEKHKVGKMYVRMFDVAIQADLIGKTTSIVPIATTTFDEPIPDGTEIIPTVYITIDALRQMHNNEEYYADIIIRRTLAMARYNNCGNIHEIQFDCDWTKSTRNIYIKLCQAATKILHSQNIILSSTIRLHQLDEEAPPVDRGVLMLYNTGAIKNPETQNSILDIADIKPYLKKEKYDIPLDYAYPTFGWGVKFKNNKFVKIVTNPDTEQTTEDEYVRLERASAETILKAKKMTEKALGAPDAGNIIYHLDYSQLQHYTDNEIAQIYSNN